jgi:hypothetical protein
MKFSLRALLLCVAVLLCSAHVGSPDAWYEGPAGPYHVLVHVQAPPVVPGIAIVNIRPDGPGITQVTAFVDTYDATGGAPPPDVAKPVADQPGWYRTPLWVMSAGSNSVTVNVQGARGAGKVVVPLVAVPSRRLGFDKGLAFLLIPLAAFLATGMFSIIGAAVRESVLPPGAEPDENRRRRARRAKLRFAGLLVVIVLGTAAWWRAEDAVFQRSIFRPLQVTALVDNALLTLTITDSMWARRNDPVSLSSRRARRNGLVADHGKLMHMFVIASDGRSAFAHLHPDTRDSTAFTTALPPLPVGNYNIFGDIVHESGFTQTLQSTITIPSLPSTSAPGDPDDAWAPGGASADNTVRLQDGSTLRWLRSGSSIATAAEAGLRFVVEPPVGDSTRLEPYMGMPGHAVVVRNDGKVFIHLHPLGTISVTAQALLTRDSAAASHGPMMPAAASDTLYFPYAFPQSGSYTVWVQVKRGGRVLTGAFTAQVN